MKLTEWLTLLWVGCFATVIFLSPFVVLALIFKFIFQ